MILGVVHAKWTNLLKQDVRVRIPSQILANPRGNRDQANFTPDLCVL